MSMITTMEIIKEVIRNTGLQPGEAWLIPKSEWPYSERCFVMLIEFMIVIWYGWILTSAKSSHRIFQIQHPECNQNNEVGTDYLYYKILYQV